ncbi:hypothetical protein CC1G_02111 [Coprinopsis cinerea okayama7|uniref:F-box domain-containing protein n=1 Tax=Coprinopsis cinerea (strain Okayama-7 / 130 / ATCC MYA-4618 / FGSC 9003) TaxID=240176 RepID=A8NK82_COPC7|nr:hypothetical protein CC1G_02111 [Coprinopsis cinerea okayama7\|eukprot:XP_001834375.2 hypothetical protein CC1G_02111 [Coprinopsis cinerea okayama7\
METTITTVVPTISKKPPAGTIGSLPDEILADIFIHYVRSHPTKGLQRPAQRTKFRVEAQIDSPNNPILLGWVSSRWRTISLRTVKLWSTIVVGDPLPRDVPIFKLWIERSGEALLGLTLSRYIFDKHDSIRYSEDATAFKAILSAAVAECMRWRTVTIKVVEETFYTTSLALPNLESIEFEYLAMGLHTFKRRLFERAFTSPVLRTISLDDSCFNPSWITGPAWNTLRNIELKTIHTARLLKVLRICHTIERVRVEWIFLSSKLPAEPVTAPTLQSLHVAQVHRYPQFLDRLILPSLVDLKISVERSDEDAPPPDVYPDTYRKNPPIWQAIEAFVERSKCQLESFGFGYADDQSCLYEIGSKVHLPIFSKLRRLCLTSKISDVTVANLTFSDVSQPLPLLEDLELTTCDTTDGALAKMVLSRMNSTDSRLKKVKAYFGKGDDPQERTEDLGLEQKLGQRIELELAVCEEYVPGEGYVRD